eukprot:5502675-Amphidinium_carterae.2
MSLDALEFAGNPTFMDVFKKCRSLCSFVRVGGKEGQNPGAELCSRGWRRFLLGSAGKRAKLPPKWASLEGRAVAFKHY